MSPSESFRDVTVHVPAGLVGYPPTTAQRCTAAQLSSRPYRLRRRCRSARVTARSALALIFGKDIVPVYNLVPPRGVPAEFGFYYQGLIIAQRAKLRPADNGIDIVTTNAPSSVPIPKFEVTLWGTQPTAATTAFARTAP